MAFFATASRSIPRSAHSSFRILKSASAFFRDISDSPSDGVKPILQRGIELAVPGESLPVDLRLARVGLVRAVDLREVERRLPSRAISARRRSGENRGAETDGLGDAHRVHRLAEQVGLEL